MNILAVDTSTPYTVLIHCQYNSSWKIKSIQVEKMNKDKDNWLEVQINDFTKNFQLDEFDGFAAGYGPGSFTGLRIGFTYLKALSILWNKIFFSFPTSALLNSIYLNNDEILLLQLNANLYASFDKDLESLKENILPLETWLNHYSNKRDKLIFWNFYNSKNPFPNSLQTLDPEKIKPAGKIILDFPEPDYLIRQKSILINDLPRYGLNVELKRKNNA